MCSFKCVYYKTRSSEPKKSEEEQRKLEEVNKSEGRITETERSKNFKIELNWKSKPVSLKRVANRKSLLKEKREYMQINIRNGGRPVSTDKEQIFLTFKNT